MKSRTELFRYIFGAREYVYYRASRDLIGINEVRADTSHYQWSLKTSRMGF